jgi:hypothetical protein
MPPVLNGRGFAVAPKRGPKPGAVRRKSPWELKIEAAEKATADFARAYARPLTGEYIVVRAIQELKKRGVDNYYLCKQGPGTASAGSWIRKWKRRWGFKRRKIQRRFRTRRNGVDLRKELYKSWRRSLAAMRALKGDEDGVTFYYVNSDETGTWNIGNGGVLVAREQEEDRQEQLQHEIQGEKISINLSVSSDKRLQIEPMVLMHKCRNYQKDVLTLWPVFDRVFFGLELSIRSRWN